MHPAEGTLLPGQAFQHGENVYGIELHREMTREMIESWCGSVDGRARPARLDVQGREARREGSTRYADAGDRWLDSFLDGFLSASMPNTWSTNP